jgi:hypothetical protein
MNFNQLRGELEYTRPPPSHNKPLAAFFVCGFLPDAARGTLCIFSSLNSGNIFFIRPPGVSRTKQQRANLSAVNYPLIDSRSHKDTIL